MNKGATAHVSTIRYTVRKGANGSTSTGVKGTSRNRKQHTTTAHTQAVSQGRATASARRCPSWEVVTVVLSACALLYLT